MQDTGHPNRIMTRMMHITKRPPIPNNPSAPQTTEKISNYFKIVRLVTPKGSKKVAGGKVAAATATPGSTRIRAIPTLKGLHPNGFNLRVALRRISCAQRQPPGQFTDEKTSGLMMDQRKV